MELERAFGTRDVRGKASVLRGAGVRFTRKPAKKQSVKSAAVLYDWGRDRRRVVFCGRATSGAGSGESGRRMAELLPNRIIVRRLRSVVQRPMQQVGRQREARERERASVDPSSGPLPGSDTRARRYGATSEDSGD